jgi:transcriptional regulator with XRE-family HTH domain
MSTHALTLTPENVCYDADMQMGRPSKRERSEFGERVFAARMARGFSQGHVAEKLGIKQPAFAAWERDAVSLKPEQIAKLAEVLQVPVSQLVGAAAPAAAKRKPGPPSIIEERLQALQRLPRDKQKVVLQLLDSFLQTNGKAV